jgi:hypothetical protein
VPDANKIEGGFVEILGWLDSFGHDLVALENHSNISHKTPVGLSKNSNKKFSTVNSIRTQQ